jgi:hypothetical protein
MTLKTAIELPSPTRLGGGLLAASRPLPDGWTRGVLFNGSTCLGPASWPYCLPAESPPSPGGTKLLDTASDVAEFEPTGIYQGVECTTLSQTRAATLATEALDVTAEYQLGLELATGADTENPSLADATPATAGDVVAAMAAIEDSVAGALFGRLAFIHVSPGMLTQLIALRLVYREGRTWRSPMGHVVVASPGYVTLGDTIHATAEVFASLSVPETRVDVDRSINQSVAYAEQVGLAAFDPCFNIAVEVTS